MDVDDESLEFDETYYLTSNPDVAREVAAGRLASGHQHFELFGRAEGRQPRRPAAEAPDWFDEAWYLAANPDVAAAVASGALPSAYHHWRHDGLAEGRAPSGAGEMSADQRRAVVGARWSEPPELSARRYWMAHPKVRERLNRLASGDPDIDSYGHLAAQLRTLGFTLPLRRAVSLGCGFGALERDLAARGIISEIDAYDIAPGAIEAAQRLAAEAGFSGLRYHVADLEQATELPDNVDVVFAHQSVHHVERLDELFSVVRRMLRPGGIFHLHEFVGPDRFQWTDAQLALCNAFLDSLPARLRQTSPGRPRPRQSRPTIEAMIAADPSESIRSSAIIPTLRRHFTIVEERALGGALLHLAMADIGQNFDIDAPADGAVLDALFAAEDAAMARGEIGSDFVVITAIKAA